MKQEFPNCLEKGVNIGLNLGGWFENDSNLDSVRDDPRFQALLEKMECD